MLQAAVLLVSLAVPARAADACLPVPGIGCYFAPENAPADAPILVFLRGHHPAYGPSVPPGQYLESSRRAFDSFGLGRIARSKAVVVLITYRSGLALTKTDLAELAREKKRSFSKTILAAHSGAYTGLTATLDGGLAPSRVILLDSFYGGDDGLSQKLQRLISAGTACAGFYTPHNKAKYDAAFKSTLACSVDRFYSDDQHNAGVGRCLAGYLDGHSCSKS